MIEAQPLDLNILPERYRPRRIRLTMVGAVLGVVAVLLGLVPVYNALSSAQSRTAYLETRLDQVRASLTQAQAVQVELQEQITELDQQVEASRDQTVRVRAELDTLRRQHTTHHSESIAVAVAVVLPRVQIVRLVQEGGVLTVRGEAGSQALVLDYARALQASGQFANVRIVSMVDPDSLELASKAQFSIELEW
jgi:Tfp pilus assembly protein PilN